MKKNIIEDKAKVIKALGKILSGAEHPINADVAVARMDSANVCEVIAKTDYGRNVLSQFIESDDGEGKTGNSIVPELKFETKEGQVTTCNYSLEYFLNFLNVLKACGDDSFRITLNNDWPCVIEGEHLKMILAPRVENDTP